MKIVYDSVYRWVGKMSRKIKYILSVIMLVCLLSFTLVLLACTVKISTYSIIINKSDYGQVTTAMSKAESGETITLTIKPNDGYRLDENMISINGEMVELKNNTFVMPAEDVNITVYFTNGTKELYYRNYDSNNYYTVTGISTYSSVSEIIIPSNYRGLPVTKIESSAFSYCYNLKTVNIADTVKEIGYGVFSDCEKLTSVKLPSGLKELSARLFYGCKNLKNINIPSTVEKIQYSAFERCASITEINLPTGLKEIADSTFSNCTSLQKINIPSLVQDIGWNAFYNCASLINITFPQGLKRIGENAFASCANLTVIKIPNTVTSIGYNTFSYCDKIASIYFMGTVTSSNPYIASYAFYSCQNLKTIYAVDSDSITNLKTHFDSYWYSYSNLSYYYI